MLVHVHKSVHNAILPAPTIHQNPKLENPALDQVPGSLGPTPTFADDWVMGGKHDACQQGRRNSSLSTRSDDCCSLSIAGGQHKGAGARGLLCSCPRVCCYWQSLAGGLPVVQSLYKALCMTAGFQQESLRDLRLCTKVGDTWV